MEDMQSPSTKVYVSVMAQFQADGTLRPLELIWEDGRKFVIDRVTDIRQAPAMKAGGQGDRYTIRINGQHSYLFFERSEKNSGDNVGRWFVERKRSKS